MIIHLPKQISTTWFQLPSINQWVQYTIFSTKLVHGYTLHILFEHLKFNLLSTNHRHIHIIWP